MKAALKSQKSYQTFLIHTDMTKFRKFTKTHLYYVQCTLIFIFPFYFIPLKASLILTTKFTAGSVLWLENLYKARPQQA